MLELCQNKIQNDVGNLKEDLKEMPRDIRLFSLSLRSLYTDKAVDRSSFALRKLRDDTREDAVVYKGCILPTSTKFVTSIDEYFENYGALSFKEWCKRLPDILEKITTYKEVAQTVLEMHQRLLVNLKKRQDEAQIIMTEYKGLEREYRRRKLELEKKAKYKKNWSIALAFIPGVNIIATPLLRISANEDTAKAIVMHSQSDINAAAALVVAKSLIPALSSFIDSLKKAAGFFQGMELDLESFKGRAHGKDTESQKLFHYKIMKAAASEIKSLCHHFYAALPDVRTDFEEIPKKDTDQNVVDKWLVRK